MAAAGKAYSKQSVKKTGRERKEKLVASLTEKLDSSNGLVFTDYKGVTHQQLETLRKELKAVDASILIAKNSLMKISLGKSKNYSEYKDNENIQGPAATLFIGNDSVEPLKKLQKSIKDTGLPSIKFGVLEGQLLDEAGVLKLASLPTREVLLAQFVGMLNSPIQGFVSGLNAIPQKFVMTLDAIASAKQNSQPLQQPEPSQTPVAEKPKAESTEQSAQAQTELAQQTTVVAEPKDEAESSEESTEQIKNETKTEDDKNEKITTIEEPKTEEKA